MKCSLTQINYAKTKNPCHLSSLGILGYVSIRCISRWYGGFVACLFVAQVAQAAFDGSDSANITAIRNRLNDIYSQINDWESDRGRIANVLGIGSSQSFNTDDALRNSLYQYDNNTVLQSVNQLAAQMTMTSVRFRGGLSDAYYPTVFGLLAGLPNNTIINSTNGIFSFTRSLSDSLTNTNSVFHRQLSAQETMTNQLERLTTQFGHALTSLTNLQYQIGANVWVDARTGEFPTPGRFQTFLDYYTNLNTQSSFLSWPYLNSHYLELMDQYSYLTDDQLENGEGTYTYELMFPGNLDTYEEFFNDYRHARLENFGTAGLSNLLHSALMPDEQDMEDAFDSGTDDGYEQNEPELEDYISMKDSRINTDWVTEAQDEFSSTAFDSASFSNFKNSYRHVFDFNSDATFSYQFSLQFSNGETPSTVDVADTQIISESTKNWLQGQKAQIDGFIEFILKVSRALCFLALASQAFGIVSKVFSA